MARWRGDLDDRTALSLNLGYGRFDSTLDRLRANPVLPTLPLLNTKSILFLTEAQPKDKITGQAVLSRGPLSVQLSTAVFGDYVSAPLVAPQTFRRTLHRRCVRRLRGSSRPYAGGRRSEPQRRPSSGTGMAGRQPGRHGRQFPDRRRDAAGRERNAVSSSAPRPGSEDEPARSDRRRPGSGGPSFPDARGRDGGRIRRRSIGLSLCLGRGLGRTFERRLRPVDAHPRPGGGRRGRVRDRRGRRLPGASSVAVGRSRARRAAAPCTWKRRDWSRGDPTPIGFTMAERSAPWGARRPCRRRRSVCAWP